MSDHPSRRDLRRWLEGEELRAFAHVETCDQCLGDLDELSRLDPVLVRTFLRLTRPRPGFVDRVQAAIERRRRDAEAWGAFTDLFSLGWRTADTIWPEDG